MSDPTLSVIIPIRNGGAVFERCLGALAAAVPPADEILVVDDGSHDGSGDRAAGRGVRVIRMEGPRGPAAARNLGAEHASGDLLFFIDADVAIHPGAIGKVKACLRSHPEAAAVIGSYDDAPADPGFFSQYKNLFHHYVHQHAREKASTFWGACGAIRREVFCRFGGFDPKYRYPSLEDVELGYRLKGGGESILLSRDLQVKHLKRWTAWSLLRTDVAWRAWPWTALILQRGRLERDLNFSLSDRVSAFLVVVLVTALCLAPTKTPALSTGGISIAALLALNFPLYRFFRLRGGHWFTVGAVLWHWFYYLYSTVTLAAGLVWHLGTCPNKLLKYPRMVNPQNKLERG